MKRFMRMTGSLAFNGSMGSRRQAAYLIVTVAIAVAGWFLLAAIAAPDLARSTSKGTRIFIQNGSQSLPILPLRYARRLMRVPGAEAVSWTTLQSVVCGPGRQGVTLNAIGGPGALRQLAATVGHLDAVALSRWLDDSMGIIIDARTARDCAWKIGQAVAAPVPGPHGVRLLELHVSGVYHDSYGPGDVAFAHFDYINRFGSLFGKDKVVNYTAFVSDPRQAELLAARIQQTFAHDFPSVDAFTNATMQDAVARFGKVQDLVAVVMLAMFLCAGLVLISVLAHSAAQRRPRFALLQIFGFGKATLFWAFALQAIVTVLTGAVLGGAGGIGIQRLVASGRVGFTIAFTTGGFAIPGWAYQWVSIWLALLVIAALGWPASVIGAVRPMEHHAP